MVQHKKGAPAVIVGGGATSTNQSVSLLFAQMRPDRKTKRPLSRERPMIWAPKVALAKVACVEWLGWSNPRKKMGDRREGHDDVLQHILHAVERYYVPCPVPPTRTIQAQIDTYPRYRELDALNKRCYGDTRYMKLSRSPDRPRTSSAGWLQ